MESWLGTASTIWELFTSSNLNSNTSGKFWVTFLTNRVRPLARIVGSGIETFNSSARLFHLCHLLKVTIAAPTVGTSVGHSRAVRIAVLSPNPPHAGIGPCPSPRSPTLKCFLRTPPPPALMLFFPTSTTSSVATKHLELGHASNGTI